MVIRINKYMLRHQGVTYRAGDTVEVSNEVGMALVAESAGAISALTTTDAEQVAANQENVAVEPVKAESIKKPAPAKRKPAASKVKK